jgi:hypothetical protein
MAGSKRDAINIGYSNMHSERQDNVGWACSLHGESEMHTRSWMVGLKEREHSQDLGVDVNTVKIVFEETGF